MTTESKTFISVNDIIGVQYECTACHARFVANLNQPSAAPLLHCPQCHRDWFVDSSDARYKDLQRMTQILKIAADAIARFESEKVSVSVSLEIATTPALSR